MNNRNGFDPNNSYNGYNQNNNGYSQNSNGYNSFSQNNNYGQNNNGYNSYGQNNNGYNGYNQNGGFNSFQQNGYNNPYQQPMQNGYGQFNQAGFTQTAARQSASMSMADYTKKIFSWLGAGLTVTFLIGFVLMQVLSNYKSEHNVEASVFLPIFFGAMIGELIMVVILGFCIRKLSYTASLVFFSIYSICNGITITPLLVVYGAKDAVFAFGAAAVLFISMAIYGTVTKRDLSKLGPILLIGLFVLLGYSIISMILGMDGSSLIISLIGIAIFIGFTAYDVQKIKRSYDSLSYDEEALKKSSVNVALELYLDFINLFIYILRLTAASRK